MVELGHKLLKYFWHYKVGPRADPFCFISVRVFVCVLCDCVWVCVANSAMLRGARKLMGENLKLVRPSFQL